MMPEGYRWKRCPQCRARGRRHSANSRHVAKGLPDDEALLFAEPGLGAQQTALGTGASGTIANSTGVANAEKDRDSETLEDLVRGVCLSSTLMHECSVANLALAAPVPTLRFARWHAVSALRGVQGCTDALRAA